MTVFSKKLADSDYALIRNIFMSSLKVEEFNAVEFYVSSGYKEINQFLLNETVDDASATSYSTLINHIHSALAGNKLGITIPVLYRGTQQEYIADWKAGDEVSFPFFLSSSTDPVVASRFAGDTEPVMLVITGVSGSYAPTSIDNGENEVLISPFSRFFIENITEGVSFQAEYDNSGFYAPAKKNVTVVEMTLTN